MSTFSKTFFKGYKNELDSDFWVAEMKQQVN